MRTNGALIAGNVLPGYEIGGDWFDYAENPSGTWIGMADAEGSGTRAAALASVALGAFRSGRHQSLDLPAMIRLMDTVVREFSESATVTTTIGFWVPPTSTFSWISCGELGPIVVDGRGRGDLLEGHRLPPLGRLDEDAELSVRTRRLEDGDRLVLVSDGIVDRTYPEGNALSIDGVVDAVRDAPFASAAGAVARGGGGRPPDELGRPPRRRHDRGPHAGVAVISAIKHRLIDVPAGRIHLAEQGTGPLVLLVHGFPESWYSWRHQLPALAAAGYRAVAIDVRGYGRSSKPPRPTPTGCSTWSRTTSRVVHALGEETAAIVGHDWGSTIAADLRPAPPRGLHAPSAC